MEKLMNELKQKILEQAEAELTNNVIADYFDDTYSVLSVFHLSEYENYIEKNNIDKLDLILEVLNENCNKLYLNNTIYYYSRTRNLYDVEKDIKITFGDLEEKDYQKYLDYCYSIHENLGLREYKGYCEYELEDLTVDKLNEMYYSNCECQDCEDKEALIEAIKIKIDDTYEKMYDEDLRHHALSI
ncbi:hypothetical protein [Brachyspira innocens]|uniref:hypothetical protein n=1 Tax=Brachyspira innocens TaxID=13264 RepID=UPI0026E9354A|nr:hypothetical protein [Brachyspira innocens]